MRSYDARIKAVKARKQRRAAGILSDDEEEITDSLVVIDAFLAGIKEKEERQIQIKLPPVMRCCSCSNHAHFCSRLLSNSSWFSKNFGCDLAQHYSVLFDLADGLPESVFIRAGDGIQQVHTLQLNDDEVYLQLD